MQISRHGLNSFFALFEVLIPRTSAPPLLHILFLIIILALYLGLAYLTYRTQGFYVYNFLNPAQGVGLTAGYIFGILAACIVVFGIVWAIIWVRSRVTDRSERKAGHRDIELSGMHAI